MYISRTVRLSRAGATIERNTYTRHDRPANRSTLHTYAITPASLSRLLVVCAAITAQRAARIAQRNPDATLVEAYGCYAPQHINGALIWCGL